MSSDENVGLSPVIEYSMTDMVDMLRVTQSVDVTQASHPAGIRSCSAWRRSDVSMVPVENSKQSSRFHF